MSSASVDAIDAMWVGEPFSPVFSQNLHPTLAFVFAAVGLVYAGKFVVTRKDMQREVLYAAISSIALGLATVLGIQAMGLYI